MDFFPAYSPELNPIERVWKLILREYLHTVAVAGIFQGNEPDRNQTVSCFPVPHRPRDHRDLHCQALCGEFEATVGIETLEILDSELPTRVFHLEREGVMMHIWRLPPESMPLIRLPAQFVNARIYFSGRRFRCRSVSQQVQNPNQLAHKARYSFRPFAEWSKSADRFLGVAANLKPRWLILKGISWPTATTYL